MQPTPASAFTSRLSALALLTKRPKVRNRLPLPVGIELHSWQWAILRGQWQRHFGVLGGKP